MCLFLIAVVSCTLCDQVPEYIYPTDSIPDYNSILVPNVDNVRTDFLIDCIVKQSKAVLLIGEQVSQKLLQQSFLNPYAVGGLFYQYKIM